METRGRKPLVKRLQQYALGIGTELLYMLILLLVVFLIGLLVLRGF